MIGILDISMGNLRSVTNAIDSRGYEHKAVDRPDALANCTHLIIPGVGAYETAMRHVDERGLREPVKAFAGAGKPVMGICLGMQILSASGTEGGETEGFGLIPGRVDRIDGSRVPAVPHVGWNTVHFRRTHPVLKRVKDNRDFYFVHSYEYRCDEPDDVLAETEYGVLFTSAVGRGNVVGFQFHPEKSQDNGLRLLDNFCEWNGRC